MKVNPYFTIGINNYIEKGEIYESDVLGALMRFLLNDWGNLCKEGKTLQYELLKSENAKKNERFIGVYTSSDIKLSIINILLIILFKSIYLIALSYLVIKR